MSTAATDRPALSMKAVINRSKSWAVLITLLAALLLLYWPTWETIFTVWNTPNYSHSYLVPVTSIWLAYTQREELRHLEARPWWLALIVLGFMSLVWAVGQLAAVNTIQHAAVIISCALVVALAFGRDVAHQLIFPLCFLLLAIPFGDFMIPYMMTWTANVTIWMVQASGVPIYREGLLFILPSGAWQVVEECSGQRYLIALVPLALIYAHLNFQRTSTRVLFVFTSLCVAVVANWIRAYLIVMTGHLSDMTLAVGVDHLLYGWLFFGLIVFLLFLWGSRWKETPIPATPASYPKAHAREPSHYPLLAVLVLGLAALSSGGLIARYLSQKEVSLPTLASQVQSITQGNIVESFNFKVPFQGHFAESSFSMKQGTVNIWTGRFKNSDQSTEMIHTRHSLIGVNRKNWRHIDSQMIELDSSNEAETQEFQFVRPAGNLLVWQLYLVNEQFIGEDRSAKANLALQQLRRNGSGTTAILIWTQFQSDVEAARRDLSNAASKIIAAIGPSGESE